MSENPQAVTKRVYVGNNRLHPGGKFIVYRLK